MGSSEEILDLKTLAPTKRSFKTEDDEKFEVTKVPAKYALEIAEKFEGQETEDAGIKEVRMVSDIMVEIINSQNDKKLSEDELLTKLDVNQLTGLLEFIMEPMEDSNSNINSSKKKGQEKQE